MKRPLIAVLLAIGLSIAATPVGAGAQAAEAVVIDTLGTATPSTTFSVFGSGGQAIFASQLIGPRFTLLNDSVITEIGAFVNNCASIIGGVPQCPDVLPLAVQIRPALDGRPDPSTVLATFELSHDDDPLVVSYESVRPALQLGAGDYFALFAPQQDQDVGFLLSGTNEYQAGLVTMGSLDPTSGNASAAELFGAVRILGHALDAAGLLEDLADKVTQLGAGSGASLVHILTNASEALAAGRMAVTCRLLDTFERATAAQSGMGMTPAQAAALIEAAADVQSALNC